jgi:hypothetical protein
MRHAETYIPGGRSNVYVCNGEGERTFPNFLKALQARDDDQLAHVRGLSFYRDGRLITTEDEPRISDLSEIPSPFLHGVFEPGKYTWMLIETNRGCPFRCNYCFWGAATGAKVYRQDEDRIRKELSWISQSGCWYLFIADANWGMLPRDVEFSRFIADAQKRHGGPKFVYFCGSKNTPARVAEISHIFHEAGMVSCQSVALQTLNPDTLVKVNRSNIRVETYTELQQSLNVRGISSFLELIWPLPGETLASFQDGIGRLCASGAECFVIYPLLLINNVELELKREQYGLVTIPDPDPNSEAEIVVRTAEVDETAYEEGARFAYATLVLHNLRALYQVARYLHATGQTTYTQLFRSFVEFCRRRPTHPWTEFCESSIRTYDHITFSNVGAAAHFVLHEHRDAFDLFVAEFVAEQPFWRDPIVQFLLEVDIVNRPYVYRNTPIRPKRYAFTHVGVTGLPNGYSIEVPPQFLSALPDLDLPRDAGGARRFTLRHRRSQLPFMPAKSLHENYTYCQDVTQRILELMPVWSSEPVTNTLPDSTRTIDASIRTMS